MTQKYKNLMVLREFIETRNDAKGNGSIWSFNADVTYKNINTGNLYCAQGEQVNASTNIQFGGYDVSSVGLDTADDVHPVWSTNFGIWKIVNGLLCIDAVGPRGKYQVTIG